MSISNLLLVHPASEEEDEGDDDDGDARLYRSHGKWVLGISP